MIELDKDALDRHITGNYGAVQYFDEPEDEGVDIVSFWTPYNDMLARWVKIHQAIYNKRAVK